MGTRRIHLLSNSKSGKGHGEKLSDLAERLCTELGATLINYEISSPADLESKSEEAVRACTTPDDVVVAAGGDGTIRSVAEKVRESDAKFAVIPVGTFNFFARAHNVPEDHEQALRLAITGEAKPVRLGEMNGRTFLINASLGIYAKSIADREKSTSRFGRNRLVVILSTAKTLLGRHRLLHVALKSKGVEKKIRTPMVFIGNNALQLRNLSLTVADCFLENLLAVVTLKPVRGWEMLRVLARGIFRTLEKEERLEHFCTEKLVIETKRSHQTVALDGEMFDMKSPFTIRSRPGAIQMIAPPADLLTEKAT